MGLEEMTSVSWVKLSSWATIWAALDSAREKAMPSSLERRDEELYCRKRPAQRIIRRQRVR